MKNRERPPLWLLDVDGVLNAVTGRPDRSIWPDWAYGRATADGERWAIWFSRSVIRTVVTAHEEGLAEVRWLTTWGEPVPPTSGEDTGHDMGGSMDGMMSTREVDQLTAARGSAFDRMWLTMMIKHHQGAITMATQEASGGAYQPATAMARSIVSSQGQEIATMQQLLTRLG